MISSEYMTAKDAVEQLNIAKERSFLGARSKQALDLAIAALKDNVPQRPTDTELEILKSGICPTCGSEVQEDWAFCPYCRTCLDWR